jgi:hypothetical protein
VRTLQLQKRGVGESAVVGGPREDQQQSKKLSFTKFVEGSGNSPIFGLLVGEHQNKSCEQPRKGRLPDFLSKDAGELRFIVLIRKDRLPDCQRHTALDLLQQREGRRSHGPRPGGSVGRHLTEMERPSPEWHDPSGVVLADDGLQGDLGSTEVPQHCPVVPEHPLLLCLRDTVGPV